MASSTIQKIHSITRHGNSENLSIGRVLGWQVVFNHNQNQYKENELIVYVEMDSELKEHPEFEFLRKSNFRIKAAKLRGAESAGIVFPCSILEKFGYDLNKGVYEGMDVDSIIGASHYEKPIPVALAGEVHGFLPNFLVMTDEINLRNIPSEIDRLAGKKYYITRKDDGTSATYFLNNNEFGVCSRRMNLKESNTNIFWRMAEKYNIKENLLKYFGGKNVAIQGELVGPGVNGNNLGLKDFELHIFNLWFIDDKQYGSYEDLISFCSNSNIMMVTVLEIGDNFSYSLNDLIEITNNQKYQNDSPAEGIVIRAQDFRWSYKVINENY